MSRKELSVPMVKGADCTRTLVAWIPLQGCRVPMGVRGTSERLLYVGGIEHPRPVSSTAWSMEDELERGISKRLQKGCGVNHNEAIEIK